MRYFANLSPRSTGKTTNSAWKLHALQAAGYKVIGYDADDSRQLSRWQEAGDWQFPVVQAASKAFHVNVPATVPAGYEGDDAIGVVDVGHLEDHKAVGWSVLRVASLAIINLPPTMNDIERMEELPMKEFLAEVAPLRPDGCPPETWVLLCKAPAGVKETQQIRKYLTDTGYQVFDTVVPAVVRYARTYGGSEVDVAGSAFQDLVSEMKQKGLL